MNLQPLQDFIKKQPLVVGIGGLLVLAVLGLWMMHQPFKKASSIASGANASKDIGISIGGADQQAYMARLEKNYYDFEERVKDVETQLKSMQSTAQELKNSQKDIAQTVLKLDQGLGVKMDQHLEEFKTSLESAQNNAPEESPEKDVELSVADINPTAQEDWVYLPIGSFCQGTLLTGVYAAADASNPLPVLISLDEAFYGPNKTRIPLKGAFVLGKAYGDLTSQRALMQIVAVSAVLPNGHAFENEQDLGYVTDEFGELGIKGQVVYNTGRQLAISLLGGFVSGGSQAVADSQVTTHKTLQGDTSKDVTGSPSKNLLFSGLAQSAGKLAEFYQKQAEDLVPAVHIKNGAKVFFIVQKGVTINGLAKSNFNHQRFMD
ncbi:MAG: TraB/VirB10 family protein [Candidatus Omnitrophica bacterium]|nr:TraB/VirB10 family protein [Candidatus Omnitrophota bacterium]